jgi:hypothetical protein
MANGDLFKKVAGVWVKQGNLNGPSTTGPTGYAPQWLSGAGAPSSGTGNNSDMYLNVTTGDVYGPKTAGAWGSIAANIKGTGVATNTNIADMTVIIDGAGVAITAGLKGYLFVDFGCTVNQWTVVADETGSIVIDIWGCTYAQFDSGATHPVVGDSITGSGLPTLASATKAQAAPTGWGTTTLAAGTVLGIYVSSCTSMKRVTLALKVTKS